MFDRKEDNSATRKTASKTTSLPEDVVIHVMPRVEKDEVVVPPKPEPKPVPPPEPPKPIVVKPIKKRRPWWKTLLLFLLMIGFFIGVLYIYQEFVIPRIGQEPEPTDAQPEVVTPDPEPEPEPEVIPLQPGLDTDSDGLTDREETLYGTDLRNPDTDADSFLDGNEVFHRFDPLALAPSTLLDNGTVTEFDFEGSEDVPSASLTYPNSWTAIETGSEDAWVLTLQPLTSSRLTARALQLAEGQDILDLINERQITLEFAADQTAAASRFTTGQNKNRITTYTHPNGRLTYLVVGEFVYEIYYDVRTERTVEYLQTFQMIVNSFQVL